VVYHKQTSKPDVSFLVLARPADILLAVSREVLGLHNAPFECLSSVYDLFSALHAIADKPAVLITRPSTLDVPHLADALGRYPNLQVIGWVGAEQRVGEGPLVRAMVPVSSREQLGRAVADLCERLAESALEALKRPICAVSAKLDPADYRLSPDELNALLGTG
jgi:hypothetical protein